MGWHFDWVSSHGSDFNFDFGVSFPPDQLATGQVGYNYQAQAFPAEEAPGISVFYRDDAGDVFHTYSTYGRGVEVMMGAYPLMDLVPWAAANATCPTGWSGCATTTATNPPRPPRRPRPLPAARTAEARPTPAGVCRAVESGTGWLRIRRAKPPPRTPFN
jgi:hypothetical protein